MQGVQILNEFIHEAFVEPWGIIGISCCLISLSGLLFLSIGENNSWWPATFMVIFFLFGIGVFVFAPKELTPRYQVIVEDDVNFNEFLNKYKIIDQNGLIYTVEERE